MTDSSPPTVAPRLVVSDGDGALAFYAAAFDVVPTDQMHADGRLVNAHVPIGATQVGVSEEDGQHNFAPSTIGGTPVILSLEVTDADAWAERFLAAGGEVVIPMDDRPYGRRDGRFEDPYGHLWIIGHPLTTYFQ